MKLSEKVRLHLDWWGQCRACKFWKDSGKRENLGEHECECKSSDLYRKITTSSGFCKKWDTFDMEAAEIVMNWDRKGKSPDIQLKEDEDYNDSIANRLDNISEDWFRFKRKY